MTSAGAEPAGGLARRLAAERNLWLCTLRPDGSPHLTPIWFVWLDGAFWVCGSTTSVKVRNVRADPRVSVALEDGNRPVVAEGPAVVHARPYPREIADEFVRKFGWDITVGDAQGDWGALLEVRVDRWLLGGPRE